MFNQIANRRDLQFEASILQWMESVIKDKLPDGKIEDVLHDGVALCRLVINLGLLRDYPIEKAYGSKSGFRMMENINQFLRAAKEFGVKEVDLFQTVDLFEKRNIPAVIQCLIAVKRIADAKYRQIPLYEVSELISSQR